MEPLESGPPVKSNYSLRTRRKVDAPKHDDAPSLETNTPKKVGIPEGSSSNPAKKIVKSSVPKIPETRKQKERRLLKYKERLEAKRAQRAMETPEQSAERKLKANELFKNYRRLRLARDPEKYAELSKRNYQKQKQKYEMETPEQTAERLRRLKIRKNRKKIEKKEASKKAAKLKRRVEALTPEQKENRRLSCRLSYQKKLSMETPEQRAERLLKKAEYKRKMRQMKLDSETPEQKAERLLKRAENRKIRQMQLDSEKPGQKAERQLKNKLRRIEKRSMETPEQKAERLEQNRLNRMKKLSMETPEQAAERILRTREYYRCLRKRETLEQREERLAKEKYIRMIRRLERNALKANASEDPKVKNENSDEDFNESCTRSSFGGSEGFYTQTSLDGSCSRTTSTIDTYSMMKCNSDKLSEDISVRSEDTSFINKVSDIQNKDDRNVKRADIISDIDFSNDLIEPSVVQEVIVKEEVDL